MTTNTAKTQFKKVSVHGGHSGDYCGHAQDRLADVAAEYHRQGFTWVCLTEHMPTTNPELIGPEEQAAGLSVAQLQTRFSNYMREARVLQSRYAGQMEILVGFETEAYDNYVEEVGALIDQHQPDMLVGSVHHIHNILFDAGPHEYAAAVAECGGIEALYCTYFDKQLELINHFEPAVVGHFDLIRIYDPDYPSRWQVPAIAQRCLRNLERIRELGLILDLNVRALKKGADEPYIARPWLQYAIDNNMLLATGDDSHGVENVGGFLADGVVWLESLGGTPSWTKPAPGRHKGAR